MLVYRRVASIFGDLGDLGTPLPNSVEPGGSAALAGSTAGPTFATLTCQARAPGLGGRAPGVWGKV